MQCIANQILSVNPFQRAKYVSSEIPLGGLIVLVMKLLNPKYEVLIPYHFRDIATFIQNQ